MNSRARISQQGLAGFVAMEITPGTPDTALLTAKPGEQFPVIYADPASSSGLAGLGEAAGNANALLLRLNNLVADNQDSIRHIITNLEAFTATMSDQKENLAAIIQDARGLSSRFAAIAEKIDGAVDKIASERPDSVVSQTQQAAVSFRQLVQKLDKSVGDRSGEITLEAERGLREFELFMRDARRLADSLDRVVQKLDRNPSGFLLGGQQSPKY